MRYFLFVLGELVGIILILNAYQIVHAFGHLDWAERYFGPAGSYFAWRLIGVGCIVAGWIIFRYGWFVGG